jgi:hypothetical protein
MAATSSPHLTRNGELPSPEELKDRFTRRTRSVTATFDALRSEIRDVTDWRAQAARHPYWVAAAAGGAVLIAFRLLRPRPPHPRERLMNTMAEALEGVAGRLRERRPARTGFALGTNRIVQAVLIAAARRALRRRFRARM